MLIDKIKLYIKAGNGGKGGVYFEKLGKPSGGDGGDGGDVIFESTNSIYDLRALTMQRKFMAENGGRGEENHMNGKYGKDVIIKVPVTSVFYNEAGEEIARLEKPGEQITLAEGGRGGLGNYYYRRGQLATLHKHQPGKPGPEMNITVELRLFAQAIFIGLPNAGKSSTLNALTNAKSKVAAYPFTTIDPHLGVYKEIILMDLPGLIEGTSEGRGVGTKFLKHTSYANLILHFISLENDDLLACYKTIHAELKKLDPRLYDLEEIVVVTKSDLYDEETIKEKIKPLEKLKKKIIVTSTYDYKKTVELGEMIGEKLKTKN